MKHVKFLTVSGLLLYLLTYSSLTTSAQSPVADSTESQDNPVIQNKADYNLGFLKRSKRTALGAIDQLSERNIQELAPLSVDVLLQGKVAGLRAIGYSGTPGSGALIRIRGNSSLNAGTTPLYIVDGIPVTAIRNTNTLAGDADINPIADINPEDIETITILKDAHATSLYGARGANGVIIIKTTSGTSGKTFLDFNGFTGIQDMPNQLSVLDGESYRSFIVDKERGRGRTDQDIRNQFGPTTFFLDPSHPDFQRYNNNTNWQNVITEKGTINNASLKLKGGDALAKYAFNVGYAKQNGVITDTKFERFNTRFNLDYKVSRKLRFYNSISYTRSDRKMQDEGNNPNTNPLLLSTIKAPFLDTNKQDPQGENLSKLDSVDVFNRSNPFALISRLNNTNNTNHILGNLFAEYDFIPGLTAKVSLSADYFRIRESKFSPSVGIAQVRNIQRYASENNSVDLVFQNENTVTYNRKLTEDHAINAVVGGAFIFSDRSLKSARSINSPSDEFSSISSGSANNIDSVGSIATNYRLGSFFGSFNYEFQDKYLVGFNVRADGSSRFGDNNRWGYFPSVAAGWRLSSEPFMANNSVFNELKLRTSYGLSGNHEIGDYSSKSIIVAANAFNFPGAVLGVLGNPDLKWETTSQFDIGLDAAFANNRLSFSTDFYVKNTKDLLNVIALPGVTGFENYLTNNGEVRNIGVEFTTNAQILTGVFGWNTNFNIAYNRNELKSLPDGRNIVTNYGEFQGLAQEGYAIGAFYGYKALGVYASDAAVPAGLVNAYGAPFRGGDIIFQDVNFDNVIDEKDKKVIGNSNPDVFGGFSNTFSYRNFDINVFLDFSYGNQVYNAQRARLEAMSGYDNQLTTVKNRWRNSGDQTDIPRALHGDPVGNTRFSSRWVEDASYTRVKALTLGYTLPAGKTIKFVNNARIYLTAQNLLTFTDYKGYDPEVASITRGNMYGVDYGSTPQLRSFILGVRLGL